MKIAAFDIGGANIKAAGPGGAALTRPYELWRRPSGLSVELERILTVFDGPLDLIAATLTGELCDCFETKAEGVRRILESVESACEAAAPQAKVIVWRTDQRLVPIEQALADPLPAAAANWLALARFAGRHAPRGRGLLVDAGSTTTDIVALEDGVPRPEGLTDTDRLISGELVYTGASRTPVAAVVRDLPYRGRMCPVATELFATTRDAYLVLGLMPEDAGDDATADRRPATRAFARDRLARMICADRETFGDDDAFAAAQHIATFQTGQLLHAAARVAQRTGGPTATIVMSGSGEFIACRIAHELGARTVSLSSELGPAASAAAPAVALARLAAEWIG